MAEFFGYDGIRNCGTFVVDATTKTALGLNPKQIEGKVVTLTSNYTVGYGSSGDAPLGFVAKIEPEASNSNDLVVSVVFNQSQEGIDCAGSEAAGNYAACNGTGGIVKSTTATNTRIWGVNATSKTATIYIGG